MYYIGTIFFFGHEDRYRNDIEHLIYVNVCTKIYVILIFRRFYSLEYYDLIPLTSNVIVLTSS